MLCPWPLLGITRAVSGPDDRDAAVSPAPPPGGNPQKTFIPLGTIPGFDEREAAATKSMFVAASHQLTRSLVSRDRCQGSIELMKKQAFG